MSDADDSTDWIASDADRGLPGVPGQGQAWLGGLIAGAASGAVGLATGQTLPWAAGSALLGGLLGGTAWRAAQRRAYQRAYQDLIALAGALPPEELLAAARGYLGGPVPADPAPRAIAAQLLAEKLPSGLGWRWRRVPVSLLVLVLAVLAALRIDPLFWAVPAYQVTTVLVACTAPARLRRRLRRLGGAPQTV
jgi:hypothetical protein